MAEAAPRSRLITLGWDIGGAHLKVAAAREGKLITTLQVATPLWQGLEALERAIAQILKRLPKPRRHVVTMTGELCDLFPSRKEGVRQILQVFRAKTSPDPIFIFQLTGSLTPLEAVELDLDWPKIASANWLASACFLAESVPEALFVDVGSTTTDLLRIEDHRVVFQGTNDFERLACGELLYLGVARTPLAVLSRRVPFRGHWVSIMNEHFATTADLFRLTGELSHPLDQHPTADGGPKDREGSARRMARMVGLDLEEAPLDVWEALALFWQEKFLQQLFEACSRQLTGTLSKEAPLIGAGIGRFLLPELARRLKRPYRDAGEFLPWTGEGDFEPAILVPASALALLTERSPDLRGAERNQRSPDLLRSKKVLQQ